MLATQEFTQLEDKRRFKLATVVSCERLRCATLSNPVLQEDEDDGQCDCRPTVMFHTIECIVPQSKVGDGALVMGGTEHTCLY